MGEGYRFVTLEFECGGSFGLLGLRSALPSGRKVEEFEPCGPSVNTREYLMRHHRGTVEIQVSSRYRMLCWLRLASSEVTNGSTGVDGVSDLNKY